MDEYLCSGQQWDTLDGMVVAVAVFVAGLVTVFLAVLAVFVAELIAVLSVLSVLVAMVVQ